MSDLEWVEELPPGGRGAHRKRITAERLADLRTKPGRWAMWPTFASPNSVREVMEREADTEAFEVISRTLDGRVRAFVRYNGPATNGVKPATEVDGDVDLDKVYARPAWQPPPARASVPAARPVEAKPPPAAPKPSSPPQAASDGRRRPRVQCRECEQWLTVEQGQTHESTLRNHAIDSPACRARVQRQIKGRP